MDGWSQAARSVWGKTDRETGEWLPLVVHLVDAAGVGGHLVDHWLTTAQRGVLTRAAGSEEAARRLVAFACGIHDLGKCSPAFAVKARYVPTSHGLVEAMGRLGLTIPPDLIRPYAPHGAVGQWAALRHLTKLGAKRKHAQTVVGFIGGHHGTHPSTLELQRLDTRPSHTGDGRWEEVRHEIWDGMAARTGAHQHLLGWASAPMDPAAQMTLTGLVIMADWIASNVRLFPYGRPRPDRLDRALDQLDLPEPWDPSSSSSISPTDLLWSRFPFLRGRPPQPLQVAVVGAVQDMSSPGLLIMEAPTGSGKTEAALLAAELLAARFGLGGTFVGLPTMATANPMFARVHNWLTHVPAHDSTTLNLVHGKAALHEGYRAFLRRSRMMELYDDDDVTASVYASSWCWGRKRAGLSSHVVATIDQALFADLRAKHVTLRQLALSGKVVIIDEVHAADDFMSVYLEGLLTWLARHGVPVVLLSATLPPDQRRRLAEAYARGRAGNHRVEVRPDVLMHYPRLTVVEDTAEDVAVLGSPEPTSVSVRIETLGNEPEDVLDTLEPLLTGGGCAGVICNTVGRAQAVYHHLRAVFDADVVLVHSKFAAPHRLARESRLVELLGPASTHRPRRLIVVGTQVLEQSLDIDFDVLFTDLAPVDLLLQRIGRLHRHARGSGQDERPPRLRTPRCYLMDLDQDDPDALDQGAVSVYRPRRLLACRAVLRAADHVIVLPADVPRLVRDAYSEAPPVPASWQLAWQSAEQREAAHRERQRGEAAAFRLAGPHELTHLNDLTRDSSTDPEGPAMAVARVRDSDESLEVVLLQQGPDGEPHVLDATGALSGRAVPRPLAPDDDELARHVSSCTVSLPRNFTAPAVLDATITELERFDASTWQTSAWLAGQLFLVLDSTGRARVGHRVLRYDPEIGLREEPCRDGDLLGVQAGRTAPAQERGGKE